MASRKGFDDLSDAYRRRLIRAGIDKAAYERGESLKAARGHKASEGHRTRATAKRKEITISAYVMVNGQPQLRTITGTTKAERSRIASHTNYVYNYINGMEHVEAGDQSYFENGMRKFRGKRNRYVGGERYELITDPALIMRLAYQGDIINDPYAHQEGEA